MKKLIVIALVAAAFAAPLAHAAPVAASCTYDNGVLLLTDFPKTNFKLFVVDQSGTTEFWVDLNGSTTLNVGVAAGPTTYTWTKFSNGRVVAECSS